MKIEQRGGGNVERVEDADQVESDVADVEGWTARDDDLAFAPARSDSSERAPEPGRTTSALLRVIGVDRRDLNDLPAEWTRYAVYGFAVLVPCALALFTLPITLTIATGRFSAVMIPIAIIWASFVYNVDRWIVSIIDYKSLERHGNITRRERVAYVARRIALFLVRLFLAGLIALSISEPLLLVIFRSEVKAEIATIHNREVQAATLAVDNDNSGKYAGELRDYNKRITNAQGAVTTAQNAYNTAKRNWEEALAKLNCETNPETAHCTPAERNGTTGETGCVGEACNQLQKAVRQDATAMEDAHAALQKARIALDTAQNNLLVVNDVLPKPKTYKGMTIAEQKKADVASAIANLPSTKGFSVREQALAAAASSSAATALTIWVVRLLLLAWELTPILLKTVSPATVYELRVRLRALRSAASARASYAAFVTADAQLLEGRTAYATGRELREIDAVDAVEKLALQLDLERRMSRLQRDHDLAMRRLVAQHARGVDRMGPAVDAGFLGSAALNQPNEEDGDLPQPDLAPGPDRGDPSSAVANDQPPDIDDAPSGDKEEVARAETGSDDAIPASNSDPSDSFGQPTPVYRRRPPKSRPDQVIGDRWLVESFLRTADKGMAAAIMGPPALVTDLHGVHPDLSVLKFIARRNTIIGARAAQQEIRIPNKISEYIAPILDSGEDDYCYFVVTPYYEQGSLQRRLSHPTALTLGLVLRHVRETLVGLSDAWTAYDTSGATYQLMHLDIKPANLMIDDIGHIKIIDWGLSSFASQKHHISASDVIRGTPWYAPPEQVLVGHRGWPKGWRSPWADIRSVGAVLYELFTGFRPLHMEARWMGLFDGDEDHLWNDPVRQLMFFRLLASTEPISILEFATHLPSQTRDELEPLAAVVSSWLKPQRHERTRGDRGEPRIALQMLDDATSQLSAQDLAGTLVGGYGGMRPPQPRPINPPELS